MKRVDSYDNDEVEVTPMYRGPLYKKDATEMARRKLIRGLLVILGILVAVAYLVVERKQKASGAQSEVLKETVPKVPQGVCPQFCQARLAQRKKHHGGDFLKPSDLAEQFQAGKNKLVEDLKVKYGSFYDAIMTEDGHWRKGFSGINKNDISGGRFRRKLKMKLLEMQAAIRADNSHMEGCNCNEEDSLRRRLEPKTIVLPQLQETYSTFVWATGGHSAAAGHGNLYNESYTAFMERSAKPIFEAVGIGFEGRNYAMGGMRSGPEFALCQESIFGLDADLVSWDFGMTDAGPQLYKQVLYMSRAAVHRNRPALVGINIHGFDEDARKNIMQSLEDTGLTTFYLRDNAMHDMTEALPDMLGMNQQQIDAIPEFVRYFKCKNQLEKDEPGCSDNKYNEALCSNRLHKADWHPGWKVNALYGQLMAFFLLDYLQGAIEELGSAGDYDPVTLLNQLKGEEDADYERFVKEHKIGQEPIENFLDKDLVAQIDPDIIHHGPLICHTTLTPSQIRYKGILTETDQVGMMDYYKGFNKRSADKFKSEDGSMRLVWDENERGPPCPVLTKADFKDFLYATEKDGWTNLTIPNDAEIAEYGSGEKPKGLIMICFILCDWGRCPEGDVREEAIEDGRLKIKINGVPVSAMSKAAECSFAKHNDGYFFKDNAGRFSIEVLVEPSTADAKQFSRITSIIVF